MVAKGKWVLLPYLVAKELTGIYIIPPGVKDERYIHPIWLRGYSFRNIEYVNSSIFALSTMQYDRDLDNKLSWLVLTDPDFLPV